RARIRLADGTERNGQKNGEKGGGVTVIHSASHPYVAALLAGSTAVPKSPAAWLDARRAAALEHANVLAVPTTRDEEWRFTDLTPLTKLQFQPVTAMATVSTPDIAAY